jgi:hypothetical protein
MLSLNNCRRWPEYTQRRAQYFFRRAFFPITFQRLFNLQSSGLGDRTRTGVMPRRWTKPAGQEAGHCTRFDGRFQHKKLQNQKIGSFLLRKYRSTAGTTGDFWPNQRENGPKIV